MSKKPLRLAFAARMRSGKDLAAEHLVATVGGTVLKFATPLYEMAEACHKIMGVEPHKDRVLLQLLGVEWGRTVLGEDVWVDHLQKRIEATPGNIFVTDCRFPNEVARLEKLGFIIVGIRRPQAARIKDGASHETHTSEAFIDQIVTGCDVILHNTGSKARYLKQVEGLRGLA